METNFLEHSRIVKKRSDRSQANIRIETILHEYSPNFATCISLHTTSPPIIEPDSITIHSSTHSKTPSPPSKVSLTTIVTVPSQSAPHLGEEFHKRNQFLSPLVSCIPSGVYSIEGTLSLSLSLSRPCSDVYRRAPILPTGIGANSKQ